MKNGFKKNFTKAMAIVLTSAIVFTGCGNSGETFATVNGEKISKAEYEKYLNFTYANVEMQYGAETLDQEMMEGMTGRELVKQQLKDELPKREAILQFAEKKKVEVKDSEVDEQLKKIKESIKEDEFKKFLTSAKLDEKGFKEIIKVDMINEKLREKLIEENKPSEKEMKKYYEEHKPELETVTASHILVDSEEEAKDISEQIKNGGKFEDFVEKSKDEGSKQAGGNVGSFARSGQMVEEFAAAAFALEPGEISDPVKSEFGYHIIRSEEKKEGYDQVKDDIAKQLAGEKAQAELEKVIKDAKIEVLMKDEEKKDSKDKKDSKEKTDGKKDTEEKK